MPRDLAVAAVLALATVSCAGVPVPEAIAGPAIVEGLLLDHRGLPLAGAEVNLEVRVATNLAGDLVDTLYQGTTTTDSSGRFVFRGSPPPGVIAHIGRDGSVDFDLLGIDSRTGGVATWTFPREIVGASWADVAPTVQLRVVESGG
jgi:hypothetical protein